MNEEGSLRKRIHVNVQPITNRFSVGSERTFNVFKTVFAQSGNDPQIVGIKKYVIDRLGDEKRRQNGNPRWVHAINVAIYLEQMRI